MRFKTGNLAGKIVPASIAIASILGIVLLVSSCSAFDLQSSPTPDGGVKFTTVKTPATAMAMGVAHLDEDADMAIEPALVSGSITLTVSDDATGEIVFDSELTPGAEAVSLPCPRGSYAIVAVADRAEGGVIVRPDLG